jgi:hypothetical protein
MPVVWFLTAPSVIYFCFVLPIFALNRWHFLGECASCIGLMYLALPILIVVAKAGIVICTVIGGLALSVLLSEESPQSAKIAVVVAFAISLLALLVARMPRW